MCPINFADIAYWVRQINENGFTNTGKDLWPTLNLLIATAVPSLWSRVPPVLGLRQIIPHSTNSKNPPRSSLTNSLVHSGYFLLSTTSLLRGAPDYKIIRLLNNLSELTPQSATGNYEWRIWPKPLYVAVRVGFESATFRMQGTWSTAEPPLPGKSRSCHLSTTGLILKNEIFWKHRISQSRTWFLINPNTSFGVIIFISRTHNARIRYFHDSNFYFGH